MEEDRDLGIFQAIQRRDFLQGMMLGISAFAMSSCTSFPLPSSKPRKCPHFSGQSDKARDLGHSIRWKDPLEALSKSKDLGETYDLVVVGAGISGLSCAMRYQENCEGRAKILLIDNNSDFGGHAIRNTFYHQGEEYIAAGGSFTMEDRDRSPQSSLEIFKKLGLSFDTLLQYRNDALYEKLGLSSCLLLDNRHFKEQKLQWISKFHKKNFQDFFSQSSLSEAMKAELITLYTSRKEYIPKEAREKVLKKISWEKYIREYMKLGDLAVDFANLYASDLCGLGCDAVSAYEACKLGPGFLGLDGEGFTESKEGEFTYNYDTRYRFPDGNHSIARLLVRNLIPEAFPKLSSLEDSFLAPIDRSQLNQSKNKVRFQLNAIVNCVLERGDKVEVSYKVSEGSQYKVRAKSVILACAGSVAKHIVPELPNQQKEAFQNYYSTSCAYINIFLKNWRPLAEIGAHKMFLPKGYCTWMMLSDPLHIGSYRPSYHPDKPTVLSMFKYFYTPGLDLRAQTTLGRLNLEKKSFVDFEREIRRELNHILGPWGFDAARDILGVQVNRWAHGYNFFKGPSMSPVYEEGKKQLGRISFAGVDSGGETWLQAAMSEAVRAADEQSIKNQV